MKKLTALFLALMMVFACAVSALADINMDYLIQGANNGLITLAQDESGDVYMETTLQRSDLSFEHPYSHPEYFSGTEFDVIIIDYAADNPLPVLRLWIRYFGTQFLTIDDVSFIVGGTTYRFDGAGSEDRRQLVEGIAYVETPAIIFGADQLPFLNTLLACVSEAATVEELSKTPVTMILHGDTDVELVLDSTFLLDFMGIWAYFVNSGCGDYIGSIQGTEMTVTE